MSPVHTAISPAASPFHTQESPVPSTSVQPLDHTPLPSNNDRSDNDNLDNLPDVLSDSDSDHLPFSDDDIDDGFGIPLNQPPSQPMVNYPSDVELEKDYELGWEWLETDPGPLIALYSNFQQCLLDPTKTKPEDYFSAFFENQMYMIMAEQTNLYARWWI